MQTVFRNAKIVLADVVIDGAIAIEGESIGAIDPGIATVGEDLDGDYLIPGLVELHTDHLENHYRPRPNVFWNPLAALHAHDVQIAGSGITTVFDAVRIGSDADLPEMDEHAAKLLDAIRRGCADGRLRAEHFVHLRCELPSPDVVEHFDQFAHFPEVRLASVMDHTPGQRQFQSIAAYASVYKKDQTDEEFAAFIAARHAEQAKYSDANRQAIFKRGGELGVSFASHDDATVEHVAEGIRDGVRISEFPTTLVAAEAAHKAGLAVLMGAPNVVRGKSHSGNISATELAKAGYLDVLSSDYVPYALMQAAFMLPERATTISLPEAVAKVTRNPAHAAGLDDRGEISVGLRADLVRVRVIDGQPVVREVWRQGVRVS
jgi:alpha-D-ribose 1-methylphosphonate 5-triphosphate diphosphatase